MAKINRLEQFILMLGSDQSGEVSAAAGMLVKQLQKEGKDLHWLVAQLHGGVKPAAPPPNTQDIAMIARLRSELQQVKNRARAARAEADQYQVTIHQLQAEIKQLKAKQPPVQPAPPNLDDLAASLDNVLRGMSQQYGYNTQHQNAQQAYAEQMRRQQNTYSTGGFGPWRQQVEWAMDYGRKHKLCDQREGNFLFEMSLKPEGFTPSYKQASWIDDIYQRLRRVEAAKR